MDRQQVTGLPDFVGVELEAKIGADGGIVCHLGHQGAGQASVVEELVKFTVENSEEMTGEEMLEAGRELQKSVIEALFDFFANCGGSPVSDAARFYEATDASYYLTAITGQVEGGPFQKNFVGTPVDIACLEYLSQKQGITASEFIRRLIRAAFAADCAEGVRIISRTDLTADGNEEVRATANEEQAPLWARMVKQMVAESDACKEASVNPGALGRFLLWKNTQDLTQAAQGALPAAAPPPVQDALQEARQEELQE